jgi:putative hydrolase of the HAD superfamily
MVKTVYFDLGNVLIFFSHSRMFLQLSSYCGLSIPAIKHLLLDENTLQQYETGKIDTKKVFELFQSASTHPITLDAFRQAFSHIFSPNRDLWPLLKELKQEGIRLILLSNISPCHFEKVSSDYPIFHLFDHKILSYEVGACKPDPLIYKTALEASYCEPAECFYTDDVPEFIEGARRQGLHGEVFIGDEALRKDLIARGCHLS